MNCTVNLKGRDICYELTYKKVKNINLRIKPNGQVCVSANKRVSKAYIEAFLQAKADFVLNGLDYYKKLEKTPQKAYFTEEGIKKEILELCQKVYPYFQSKGVAFPQIKFRSMVSKWGCCNSTKKILTFNTKLMYVPEDCVEYVVLHEFTHFLQANHSPLFYKELEKVCPLWKEKREKLKINIR